MKITTLHLEEGINDKNILKAILLAGGPGSGKSFITREVIGKKGPVSGLGVIAINSDEFFEKRLEREKLPSIIDQDRPELYLRQMEERKIAKAIASTRLRNILNGMLPIIIDGTGRSLSKIIKQKAALENIGYDVGMIFVDTSLEVALERNEKRKERSLDEKIVIQAWNKVQKNKAAYKSTFSFFKEIENNKRLEGKELQRLQRDLFRIGKSFYESPLKNKKGKDLLKVMELTGAKTISDLSSKARKEPIPQVEI